MKLKKIVILLLIFFLFSGSFCSRTQIGIAQLNFVILDAETQQPIPGKLVFLKGEDDKIDLQIPETFGLAPQGNGFFTAFGKGEVSIPAGDYTIYASRGMEYSIDKKEVSLDKDAVIEQKWIIKREIDPAGYVGADFHMHTINSGAHCSVEERVTGLVGEGVEFAVASDHNFVTDYVPAEKKLGVDQLICTCPGNELSTTNIGHFNIFPLPAGLEAFDEKPMDAKVHFNYRNGLPKPVVNQVNHPRSYKGSDYFGLLGLNPVTSEVDNPNFSWNFDAMEIMNETIWQGVVTSEKDKISLWGEWFNFLNKGFRVTGTGNSDSHRLLSTLTGWPRNYIASVTDNPAELNPYILAENIIQHKVSVSRGVFVNLTINQKWPIGSDVVDTDGAVNLYIEVTAPSWVIIDRVTLYGNAREIWSEEIQPVDGTLTYKKEMVLKPDVDTWYVVIAEGSQSLWPIVPDQNGFPVTPIGFTNPIWVDINGKGFETERDRAKRFIQKYEQDIEAFKIAVKSVDWWLQRQIIALLPKDGEMESVVVENFLLSGIQIARDYAYVRVAERADKNDIQLLQSAKSKLDDKDEQTLIDTYIVKYGSGAELMDFMLNNVIKSRPSLRMKQCGILSLEQYPETWHVVGPFEKEGDTGLNVVYPPEKQVDLQQIYDAKGGKKIQWQQMTTEEKGYINLKQITSDTDNSLGYAFTTVQSAEAFKTVLFVGSDDGVAIWHNGKELFRHLIGRSAYPYEECIPIKLTRGENTFLVKVENGVGNWEFYFEIFDPHNCVFY